MPHRIDIQYKIEDSRAEVYKMKFIDLDLSGRLQKVALVNSYSTNLKLNKSELEKVMKLLTNPIIEECSLHPLKKNGFDWVIERGFLPGVTDNVGNTAEETIADSLKRKFKPSEKVFNSELFYLSGRLSEKDVQKIASSLYNPLIQSIKIKSEKNFKKDGGMGTWLREVKLKPPAKVLGVNLEVSDEILALIGKNGITGPDGRPEDPWPSNSII